MQTNAHDEHAKAGNDPGYLCIFLAVAELFATPAEARVVSGTQ